MLFSTETHEEIIFIHVWNVMLCWEPECRILPIWTLLEWHGSKVVTKLIELLMEAFASENHHILYLWNMCWQGRQTLSNFTTRNWITFEYKSYTCIGICQTHIRSASYQRRVYSRTIPCSWSNVTSARQLSVHVTDGSQCGPLDRIPLPTWILKQQGICTRSSWCSQPNI